MKRAGSLSEAILDRDNFRLAFSKALAGKRHREDARRFSADVEQNIARMIVQLADGELPVGRHHQFVIHDPKERVITAPCFEERVLHHAIMNVCEPVFERWLIDVRVYQSGRRIQLALPTTSVRTGPGEWSYGSNRGGSWMNSARNCRSAYRNRNTPANRNNNLGFRLALAPPARSQNRRLDGTDRSPVPIVHARLGKSTP